MGFIETSYGGKPNLSDVNIDSNLNLGLYGITTDGELDINDSDLIGVKRFVCADYLGAIQANASNNTQWTLILNDTTNVYSKTIRVPSNIINGSTMILKFYAKNIDSYDYAVHIFKNSSPTPIESITIPKNTTTPTEFTSNTISINPGDLFKFKGAVYTVTFLGSMGVKIMCDLSAVTGGYWEISD